MNLLRIFEVGRLEAKTQGALEQSNNKVGNRLKRKVINARNLILMCG